MKIVYRNALLSMLLDILILLVAWQLAFFGPFSGMVAAAATMFFVLTLLAVIVRMAVDIMRRRA